MAKKNQIDIAALLTHLGLSGGATQEDITKAIEAKAAAAAAAALAARPVREAVAKFTPYLDEYGLIRLAKCMVRVGYEEVELLISFLQGEAFKKFLKDNAKGLKTRKESAKARSDAFKAAKAAAAAAKAAAAAAKS